MTVAVYLDPAVHYLDGATGAPPDLRDWLSGYPTGSTKGDGTSNNIWPDWNNLRSLALTPGASPHSQSFDMGSQVRQAGDIANRCHHAVWRGASGPLAAGSYIDCSKGFGVRIAQRCSQAGWTGYWGQLTFRIFFWRPSLNGGTGGVAGLIWGANAYAGKSDKPVPYSIIDVDGDLVQAGGSETVMPGGVPGIYKEAFVTAGTGWYFSGWDPFQSVYVDGSGFTGAGYYINSYDGSQNHASTSNADGGAPYYNGVYPGEPRRTAQQGDLLVVEIHAATDGAATSIAAGATQDFGYGGASTTDASNPASRIEFWDGQLTEAWLSATAGTPSNGSVVISGTRRAGSTITVTRR